MSTDSNNTTAASIDTEVAQGSKRKRRVQARRHGYAPRENRPPEYRVWSGMKARCYNPNVEKYPHYGGRGICVCAGWRDDFAAFYRDIGSRPSDDHEIDRRDNDGNYSCGKCDECVTNGWPANCKWSTHSENLRNQSDNHLITYNGETLCLMEWAERTGLDRQTIADRIEVSGWTVEKALTTPKTPLNRCNVLLIEFNGETLSISEWARKIGLKITTLQRRIAKGWPAEKALTTPKQELDERNAKYLTFNGKTMSYTAWSKEMGIGKKILTNRIANGWSVERALTTPVIKRTG